MNRLTILVIFLFLLSCSKSEDNTGPQSTNTNESTQEIDIPPSKKSGELATPNDSNLNSSPETFEVTDSSSKKNTASSDNSSSDFSESNVNKTGEMDPVKTQDYSFFATEVIDDSGDCIKPKKLDVDWKELASKASLGFDIDNPSEEILRKNYFELAGSSIIYFNAPVPDTMKNDIYLLVSLEGYILAKPDHLKGELHYDTPFTSDGMVENELSLIYNGGMLCLARTNNSTESEPGTMLFGAKIMENTPIQKIKAQLTIAREALTENDILLITQRKDFDISKVDYSVFLINNSDKILVANFPEDFCNISQELFKITDQKTNSVSTRVYGCD